MTQELQKNKSDIHRLNSNDSFYYNYDLGIATALLCADFELLSVDKTNPRKALFIFKREDGIEEVVNQYFSNRLNVKGRLFFDNLKALKNKLYSE